MNVLLSKSVLIVDNDPGVLEAISARLDGMGYRCHAACSGGQALALFKAHGADLVISDLNMPGGDGQSLAENLRRLSDVPLIIMSGFKDASRTSLGDMPSVSFLQKPFESEELIGLVDSSLHAAHSPPAGS